MLGQLGNSNKNEIGWFQTEKWDKVNFSKFGNLTDTLVSGYYFTLFCKCFFTCFSPVEGRWDAIFVCLRVVSAGLIILNDSDVSICDTCSWSY